MPSKKLTLSVPEQTIQKAKIYAKRRKVSVSKLFADSIEKLEEMESEEPKLLRENPELYKFLGSGSESIKAPFDSRSERILEKHG